MTDQLLQLLLDNKNFVLTTHIRPDGDALGSQLALGFFLEKLGKNITMINSDLPPNNLGWLPGVDKVEVFSGSIRQREAIHHADVIIILDTNVLDRIGNVGGPVEASTARKVLIDHHTLPESWYDVMYLRDTASSTGELVYEIITAHNRDLIDSDIATTLYAAIMTDTGTFRYSYVTSTLHCIIADLIEKGGISPEPIHAAIYDMRTMQGLRLLSRALDSITLFYHGQIAYIIVSKRMLRDTGSTNDDTEGFVNYALSIEGVKAAVLFYETEKGTKLSFRSKGETYVNEWARSLGGGGHRNASGAFVKRPLDETIRTVLASAPRYLNLMYSDYDDEELTPEDTAYLDSLLAIKKGRS